MESGAKGCEVVVSGKLRGQRAKSMKFVDGLMIHSGEPCIDYVDTATRHVLLRQGLFHHHILTFSLKESYYVKTTESCQLRSAVHRTLKRLQNMFNVC